MALGPKYWLFTGNHDGGRRAEVPYSLIESAKWSGKESLAYLQDLVVPDDIQPAGKCANLMLRHWTAA